MPESPGLTALHGTAPLSVHLLLEQSNFSLEDKLPHPENNFFLHTDDAGLRLTSAYKTATYQQIIPLSSITSIEVMPKYLVERKKQFSKALFVLLTILCTLFIKLPAPYSIGDLLLALLMASVMAFLLTALIGMIIPAETVYRKLRFRLVENGAEQIFTARYKQNFTEEVHGFFLYFLPEKFQDPQTA